MCSSFIIKLLHLPLSDVVLQSHDIVCIHYDLEDFVRVFSKLLQDERGDTPLINACRGGHIETAGVLVEHRANVDQQNNVSSIIQWNPLKRTPLGPMILSTVARSLAQGLVVDLAHPIVAASYDKALLWTMKNVLMRRLSTDSSLARIRDIFRL